MRECCEFTKIFLQLLFCIHFFSTFYLKFNTIQIPQIFLPSPLIFFLYQSSVLPLDNIIIQTYRQRSAPYTNLYTLTKRCYWLDSKIYSQPEFRNLSTPIKQPIACIQIQTGSLVLILVYIFICLMFYLLHWPT